VKNKRRSTNPQPPKISFDEIRAMLDRQDDIRASIEADRASHIEDLKRILDKIEAKHAERKRKRREIKEARARRRPPKQGGRPKA
jgi:hypothetical protein